MDELHSQLNRFVSSVTSKVFSLRESLGLIPENVNAEKKQTLIESEVSEVVERTWGFIQDSNEMCKIWHSKKCEEDRAKEANRYGDCRVYKCKCIDGRKPRSYEGEADSLKTEEALIALDIVGSEGALIPRQQEIRDALSDVTIQPLEISLAHYDSHDPSHGCAAIALTLQGINNPEEYEVWKYLTKEERDLILEARRRGNEEANLVLLALTNERAFTNYHNQVRRDYNATHPKTSVPLLKRVGIVALFDTLTMGIEVRTPLLTTDPKTGQVTLTPLSKRENLVTTELANTLKRLISTLESSVFPTFGNFADNFTDHNIFVEYSHSLTNFTDQLYAPLEYFKDSSAEFKAINQVREAVATFVRKYFSDLTTEQANAFEFRMLRSIAHQYLTGLSEIKHQHPFSSHDERYSAISEDANYPGKYVIKYQTFRMSNPDPTTGAKRLEIAAQVMDKTDIDQGKTHIFFVSTSLPQKSFDNRLDASMQERYQKALSQNEHFYSMLLRTPKLLARVQSGNILLVGVLINERGEVIEVVEKNSNLI